MKSLSLCNNLSSRYIFEAQFRSLTEVSIGMTSILVKSEDRLEGVADFNIWKTRIMNILEEHDLDHFVTNVIEEPTTNAGRAAFRRNQSKVKRIIYDSVMAVLTPIKTRKEYFDTLTNLYEIKAPNQKRVLKK